MKKYIVMLVAASLMLTGSIAYADETASNPNRDGIKTRIESKAGSLKERFEEIRPLTQEIRSNRTEILRLRVEAREIHEEIKKVLKAVREQKDTLTGEQIEMLKEAVEVMKDSAQEIEWNMGKVHDEVLKLRVARKDQNIDGVKENLQNIIDIQESRIENINKIIRDMNDLLSGLNIII